MLRESMSAGMDLTETLQGIFSTPSPQRQEHRWLFLLSLGFQMYYPHFFSVMVFLCVPP